MAGITEIIGVIAKRQRCQSTPLRQLFSGVDVYTLLCHYLIIHVGVYTSRNNDVGQNQDQDRTTFMTLRSRTGLTQEDLAAQLSREFKALGSYRKVTKKSISDWAHGL